jgi:hypothetical protein
VNPFFKFLFISSISIFFSINAFSQASLVPSYHPVYEWLYLQRIKGDLPNYDYESLPLTRSTINGHLRTLANNPHYETGKERKNLDSFIQEFDRSHLNRSNTHSLITNDTKLSFDRFKDWIWSDTEKHVYSYSDSLGFLVLDHGFGRRAMFVNDSGNRRNAPYIINQHWRTYGSYKNIVGYHVEMIRGVPVGYQRIFEYDGFYSYNWKYLNKIANNNYHFESNVTGDYSIFEASIGRGNLKEGVGQRENLTFSRSSITFDWLKLKIGDKKISYSLTHGTLSWPSKRSVLPTDSTVSTKNSPRRWVAYHKVNIKPTNWLSMSVYEMINYSNRGAEIAYINPVNRYAFAEWELQDQDNGWMGAQLIARPLSNLEVYTELLIDDLGNKADIFKKKEFPKTSRFGRRYGVSVATNSDLLLWTEYTRLDPFLYSHPYDLNSHTDKGIGLGSQIGPNADRSEIGIKLWGLGRSFITFSYSYNRQGLDRFDNSGDRIFLAGASPNDGRDLEIDRTNLFLDGDLHTWHRLFGELEWELKRNYVFKLQYEQRLMIEGEQLANLNILWADFVIGF